MQLLAARAVAAGATTTCSLTADLGTCLGERACTAAGLTDCDARTPALDDCNGQDDDCDGETDEAYLPGPCTIDNAWGSCPGTTRCGFDAGTECVGPTPARESCGDAVDSDCDGESDDEDAAGCTPFYVDLDGDGFGVGAPRCLCAPSGDYAAPVGGDCDDAHGNARPNGSEVCDGLDNDCDGATDDAGAIGCSIFFHDGDGDHFGDPDDFACLCAPDAVHGYSATAGSDCDDGDDHANPSAPEVCDGKDDDCDTLVDEEGAVGCALHFADGDGDGWGDSTASACLCAPEAAFPLTRGGDCDDARASANPGASEACGDAVDNDCDGQTDEQNALGCSDYHRDSDGDHYGAAESRCLCAPAAPFDVAAGGDCDDNAAAIHPAALEACNGRDDNCDQLVDEPGASGCQDFHLDTDLDGFGVDDDVQCLCAAAVPYGAARGGDCD
ncbi:MAG: putative metal-binding motif-containing protein, partial [Myxococcota bacterium]